MDQIRSSKSSSRSFHIQIKFLHTRQTLEVIKKNLMYVRRHFSVMIVFPILLLVLLILGQLVACSTTPIPSLTSLFSEEDT